MNDLGNTANSIDDDSPDVSPRAIESEQKEENEKKEMYSEYRDNKNNPFDTTLHVTDKDGAPVLSKIGRLRRKPGVKKDSSKIPFISQADSPNFKETGRETVNIMIALGKAFGGEEWEPILIMDEQTKEIKVDEYTDLCDKFSKYYEAKGVSDFPPGIALSIGMLAYVGPRLFKPHTQSKLSGIKNWIKNKLNFKSKKVEKDAAHSDNGDNRVGEVNSSEGTS